MAKYIETSPTQKIRIRPTTFNALFMFSLLLCFPSLIRGKVFRIRVEFLAGIKKCLAQNAGFLFRDLVEVEFDAFYYCHLLFKRVINNHPFAKKISSRSCEDKDNSSDSARISLALNSLMPFNLLYSPCSDIPSFFARSRFEICERVIAISSIKLLNIQSTLLSVLLESDYLSLHAS
nr:MAG TPA: hypothetical protein [Caudoviricetes sp.]